MIGEEGIEDEMEEGSDESIQPCLICTGQATWQRFIGPGERVYYTARQGA
jgi:hypothetical protein